MELLNPKCISFEFFPPKSPEGLATLTATATKLEEFQPEFFSVTFGAGGSTRDGTMNVVKMLLKNNKVAVAPHLACIGATREEMLEVLYQFKLLGLNRLVLLRGDMPSGMCHVGDFEYASDLVSLVRETTGDHFHIEVAAYPEVHPQAKSALHDILNFKRKVEAGANSAITQYFFNADSYFYFLDACAKQGVFIPVVPGIMPIYQFNKLVRFSELCGAEIPRWIYKRLEAYGDDQDSIRQFGLEVVYNLCDQLIAGGAPGLHFYTLNQADVVTMLLKHFGGPVVDLRSELHVV